MNTKKKVLFLYVLAGEGHLAICKAIKDSLDKFYPEEFESLIFNAFAPKDKIGKFVSEDLYRALSSYLTPLYGLIYVIGHLKLVNLLNMKNMESRMYKHLAKKIDEFKPDLIVIAHPLIVYAALKAAKISSQNPLFLNTVLDLTPGPWYFTLKDLTATISNNIIKETAIKKFRYREDKLVVTPPPLKKGFYLHWTVEEKNNFKKTLGFRIGKKLILLAGGGEGLPYGELVLHDILRMEMDIDIAVVCGRNESLKRNAEILSKPYLKKSKIIKVFGFIDFMPDLMHASDIIVSKAGFSGIFEALTLRKILIISYYIWGQEHGNAMFIKNNNLGFVIKKSGKVAEKIKEIILNPEIENEIKRNIQDFNFENGAEKISRIIKYYIENKQINQ